MISHIAPLFAAATPAHDAGGLPFGINPGYVLMQMVSFAILAFVLYRFAIKPTLATMDERNAKIGEGLKNAEATAAKLAEAQKDYDVRLREAEIKANKIVEDAKVVGKEIEERLKSEATAKAASLLAKANEAAELERKKIMAEAQQEIARLVVATTERVLAKKLTDADRASYNEAAARELTSV
jgi:F-type H+-transporting ATPase subunit b